MGADMDLWQAAVLGVVQGFTEFLPVSSKGHLLLVQTLFAVNGSWLFFDVLLHLASLLAVCLYFWPRWRHLPLRTWWLVVLASLPVLIAGFFIEPYFELYFKRISVAGVGWLITAGLLLLANRTLAEQKGTKEITPRSALITGLFQLLAFFPGVSRSGSTLSGSLMQGIKRDEAFSLAFLLSVPAILGAFALELTRFESINQTSSVVAMGFMTALGTSFLALRLLDTLVKQAKLHYFAYYCLALGLGTLAWVHFAI